MSEFHQGYFSIKKNLSKKQRRAKNRKLAEEKVLQSQTWLPLEEYRKFKKEQEILNFQPPLPLKEITKPPEPPLEKVIKVPKGVVHPNVFKKLNLDAKIILFRRSVCQHFKNPKTCIGCKNKWKKEYKIPRKSNNNKNIKHHCVLE